MRYIMQIDRLGLGVSRTGLQGKERWVFEASSDEHARLLAKRFVEMECRPGAHIDELYGVSPQANMVRDLLMSERSLLDEPLGAEDWRMVDGMRFTSVPMGSVGSLLSYLTYGTVPTFMKWMSA